MKTHQLTLATVFATTVKSFIGRAFTRLDANFEMNVLMPTWAMTIKLFKARINLFYGGKLVRSSLSFTIIPDKADVGLLNQGRQKGEVSLYH